MDFAARWLQAEGKGYYTIGSAGHESNAALGLLTRSDDPALLHYRSGGFYVARAARVGQTTAVRDLLLSLTCVQSRPDLGWATQGLRPSRRCTSFPQTSTIGSHLPRAVGLAYSLGLAGALDRETPWPADAIVVCSFGDASANHSTATGALNAASYLAHREVRVPRPVRLRGQPDRDQHAVTGRVARRDARRAFPASPTARRRGRPPEPARADGGASSDWCGTPAGRRCCTSTRCGSWVMRARTSSAAYRSRREIAQDYEKDPLLATARCLLETGQATPDEILEWYERVRVRRHGARPSASWTSLVWTASSEVMAPLALPAATAGSRTAGPSGERATARRTAPR